MSIIPNPSHEAFAQARFAGKSLVESLEASGLQGDESTASQLSRTPEVRGRVAELFRAAATQSAYEKREAVQDLLAILHTCPADVTEDSPLCEVRRGAGDPSYRLPSKQQALSRLIKLMDWDHPEENKEEKRDTMRDLLHAIRTGTYAGDPSRVGVGDDDDDESEPEPEDIETRIARIKAKLYGPPEGQEPEVGNQKSEVSHQKSELSGATTVTNGDAQDTTGLRPPNLSRAERTERSEIACHRQPEGQHRQMLANRSPEATRGAQAGACVKLETRNQKPHPSGVETACGYRKEDAIGDLITILRSSPAQAGDHHPLCERRMSSWGSYDRFPSKLAALTLLARVQGWNAAPVAPHDPDFHLRGFLQRMVYVDDDKTTDEDGQAEQDDWESSPEDQVEQA